MLKNLDQKFKDSKLNISKNFIYYIIGPIVLIIFKNIFANSIDQGVFKTIFDKK